MARVLGPAAAAALAAALLAWVGGAYLDYSDGVYLLTARLVLDGSSLYSDVVAAQPPPVYWLGAGLLALDESVWAVRAGLTAVALAEAALVAWAVRRLTASGRAAAAAAALSLLTPWALREHLALVPENLAAPLLLLGALLASRPRTAAWAGAAVALAVTVKVAFAFPALAVLVSARRRGAAFAGAAATGLAAAAVTLLLYGGAALDNVVVAQLQSGTHPLRYVGELWAAALWAEAGLLVLAALAWRHRARLADPDLAWSLFALLLGAGALVLTLYKDGSFLQVLVVLEGVALVLAVAGVVALRRAGVRQRPMVAGIAAAAVAFVAAQSASVLLRPTAPPLLTGPWSADRLGWPATGAEVRAALDAAPACPPGAPHPGPPYMAFRADRGLAAGQADEFIITASTHAAVRADYLSAAAAACPAREQAEP